MRGKEKRIPGTLVGTSPPGKKCILNFLVPLKRLKLDDKRRKAGGKSDSQEGKRGKYFYALMESGKTEKC